MGAYRTHLQTNYDNSLIRANKNNLHLGCLEFVAGQGQSFDRVCIWIQVLRLSNALNSGCDLMAWPTAYLPQQLTRQLVRFG